MPMQIRGTLTPDNPPTGLAERQLCVEMASTPPVLWCGVPTSIDASGRVRLNAAGGIPEPSTAGNFLRTNVGTWVAGLPLSGGTLNTVTGAADGLGLTVTNNRNGAAILAINSDWNGSSSGINTRSTSLGPGLLSETYGAGPAIATSNWSATTGDSIYVNLSANGAGSGSGVHVLALETTAVQQHALYYERSELGGTFNKFVVRNDGSTVIWCRTQVDPALDVAVIANSDYDTTNSIAARFTGAPVIIGAPTGPAVTGAGNVNIAGGYYVNGVQLTGGAADPSTAGNFLRTNTGTWVPGLPLTGGTIASMTNATAGVNVGLSLTNARTDTAANTILIQNNSTVSGSNGLAIANNNASRGLFVGNNANGVGIYIDTTAATTGNGITVNLRAGNTGNGIGFTRYGNSYCLLLSDSTGSTATVPALYIRTTASVSAGGIEVFCNPGAAAINVTGGDTFLNGLLTIGAPTGSAVTGAGNVNVQGGYYVNGVAIGTPPFMPLGGMSMTTAWTFGIVLTNIGGNIQLIAGPSFSQSNLTMSAAGIQLDGPSLFLNGAEVTLGDPDSGGTGYRCLRVPN